MCEINAYIFKDGSEELYLENVDTVKQADDKVYLRNLFGEQKEFEGMIREFSFRKNKILLEGK
jgi:predicted RNA-binding protein